MLKLFNRLVGRETNVTTKLDFYDPTNSSVFIPLSFTCNSNNDFSDTYEGVKAEVESVQSSNTTIAFGVKIKLSGKLNGSDINQEFKDLDSYRQFLENNSLIKPSIRLVN